MLTVYGIETNTVEAQLLYTQNVATVLTVYGIETLAATGNRPANSFSCNSAYRLRY